MNTISLTCETFIYKEWECCAPQ